MKNNYFKKLLSLLLFVFLTNKTFAEPRRQVKGAIEVPISIKDVPEFVIRFQGKQTINKNDGIFSFILNKKESADVSTLLICEEIIEEAKKKIKNKRSKNTIKNFLVDTSKPYKFYELDLKNDYFGWIQKDLNETDKEKHLAKIPQNTIIFSAIPDIVERVDLWPIFISTSYVGGPKIILKDIAPDDLLKASESSLAKSIDSACYFEKNQTKVLPSNSKNKISVPD